ncbi:MAG: TmcC family electron transfer complex membrane anchor subunit [Desulfovibrio sp.]
MTQLYDILTGPVAWLAFGLFVFGGLFRIISMYSLAKKKETSCLHYMSFGFSFRSIFNWLIPFNALGWKANPALTVATFAFHICLIALAIFTLGHVALWEQFFGITLPALPDQVSDIMTMIALAACAYFVYRRLTNRVVKFVTTGKDWVTLILATLPFLTGFLAYHQVAYDLMIILHIASGLAMLALVPFTRLSHMLFALFTRAYIGSEFGGVRNTRDW